VVDTEGDLRDLTERLAPIGATDVQPLSGGASSLTYTAVLGGSAVLSGDDRRRVVVKVAPAGLAPVRNRDVLRQARLLRALGPTAVPVPEVLWEDAGDPPEVPPLFVMSFVEGTSLEPLFDLDDPGAGIEGYARPERYKRVVTDDGADAAEGHAREGDIRRVVAERMRNAASTLAALHTLGPADLQLDNWPGHSGHEPVTGLGEEIDRWRRLLGTVDPALAPGWEAVAAALSAHVPRALPGALVHGDFRLGNMLAAGPRITAVVDWEIWSVGDPRVDVGWFLANADPDTYRRATPYAGALPTPGELVEIYLAAGGPGAGDLNAWDLGWFRALASFKSAATWSAIVKHNRRRGDPDPGTERMAAVIPHLLERATEFLG
jgi:aminoglycoside phosphotransferase (APT) family kinase protein